MTIPYPVVDYDVHPAFEGPSDASQPERSAAFAAVIGQLDELFEPIRSSDQPLSEQRVRRMSQARLTRCLDDARRLLHAGQGPREIEAIDAALADAAIQLPAEAAYRSRMGERNHGASPFVSPVARAIDETGAFECQLDADGKQRLIDLLEPRRRLVDEQRSKHNFYKALTIVPQRGPEADLVVDLLNDVGIPAGFAEFFNRKMSLHFWTLIRSDPTEVWWKDPYRDAGVSTSPTTYFHVDARFEGPKVMIYLSDVTDEHGPFEYLPGSHRWDRSISLEILNKQIERAHKKAWVNENTAYYRPYMQLEEFRSALMNLPTPARQQSHFGDDVLEGSELHAFVESNKRTVLSKIADCVAFDGNRMTHRGALAGGATRWALQVGFEPTPGAARTAVRRGRSAAASLLGRKG